MRRYSRHRLELRHRFYEILEQGPIGNWVGRLAGSLIVLLIVINLFAVVLESVPEYEARYAVLFGVIEILSLAVFTSEYLMRIWVAVEHAPYVHSRGWHARIKYVTSPIGVVDLLAVLPFWLMLVLPAELKVLLVFRVVRFLKLARYSPGMRSLLEVLYVERRALFGCSVILTGAALMAATVMHVLERHVQPDKFGTIPDAMWWAIVTLGTIGYGDVVPITPLGRVVAARNDLHRSDHGCLARRNRRHCLRERNPPARFRRHLGHACSRSLVFRAQRCGNRRHHAVVARAASRGR